MKVLVGELGQRRGYVTSQIYQLMAGLIELGSWTYIETSRLWKAFGTLGQKLVNVVGELPEAVLFLEEYAFVAVHRQAMPGPGCRTAFFADDLHREMETKETVFAACDVIVTPNAHVFDLMYPRLAGEQRTAWLPNCASPEFLISYNENPAREIFLSGAINHYYPLRLKMRDLHERGVWPIAYHPHPGYRRWYDHARDDSVGKGYAGKINRCLAGFTDSLTLHYLVAKYFEIPATGALLLADDAVSEAFSRLGFIKYQHYVPVSETTLEDGIEYVLNERNRDEVDRIRRAGQELVWARHKTSDRIRQLDEICSGHRGAESVGEVSQAAAPC